MNATAQLQTAQKAFSEGRPEEGRRLLEAAAKSGDASAAYSFAVALAYGQGGPVDRRIAASWLAESSAEVPAARQLHRFSLAHGWAGEKNWEEAVSDLTESAKSGNPAALREAGLLCLILNENEIALSLLDQAANTGDMPAGMALLRLEQAIAPDAGWAETVRSGLLRSKHPLANELSENPLEKSGGESTGLDWPAVTATLSRFARAGSSGETLIENISAVSYPGALPAAVCDYVISSGLRALQPSTIVDPQTGQKIHDPHRQSLSMTFAPHLQDLVHVAVERVMCTLAGCPAENSERLNLLFYRPGEQYRPHVDYFAPDDDGNSAELARSGQRVATSLVCLHAASEGGGTGFPRFETAWNGQPGDGLTFRNVKTSGEVEPLSLHQGEAVAAGWKALASLWIRDREFAA
ncbi:hypothetical protein V0U79_12795 [Hyphobacterium sp. HN65]|uniref:Prolyl 4-hydroxylase alpha subunit domain-containing protein n=1 Tax=Hyphobacterium lacteum TaxID=3116575 RepID=A0ABU7LTL6_9PROT|nr:hypothetical protein [Hyphobacterium sp. HN65]MEE2527242.1 hypothetical protein [Hyphobacterium sp. HN65]